MDTFKKTMNRKVGIGGVRCACCNDYYGHRNRKRLGRYARRVLKQALRREHPLNSVNER